MAIDASGKTKIDIIAMDACLMQMIEVPWELSGAAGMLVGSQTVTPGGGNDYSSMLNYLNGNSDAESSLVAGFFVDDFQNQYSEFGMSTSYSAIQLGAYFEDFKAAFINVVENLTVLPEEDLVKLKGIRKNETSQPDSDMIEYIDLMDCFGKIQNELSDHYDLCESINLLLEA